MSQIRAGNGMIALYRASTPTLVDNQGADLALDVNGNLLTSLGTLLAGEDLTNNLLRVEEQFVYTNIISATTTIVKSGAGLLHTITINKFVASESWTLYDNTAGSGTKIGTIVAPAALLENQVTLTFDVKFTTGLTIVSAQASDGTVATR